MTRLGRPAAILTAASCIFLGPGLVRAATTTRFVQAEGASFTGACLVETNQAGFTGTAFVNCPNDSSSAIQWNGVQLQSTGNKRLRFRYANGSGTNRTAELTVNGVVVQASFGFPATAGWTSWSFASADVPLNVGSNTVRLRGTTAQGLANIDRMDVAEIAESAPDWSIALAESTMLRSPRPEDLGDWEYSRALVLHGMYLLYKRTGDARYLGYLKAWVDKHVNANGDILRDDGSAVSLNSLDNLLPGNVVLDWWIEDTNPSKSQATYRIRRALQTLRNRFTQPSNTSGGLPGWSSVYPRTSDNGFWHNTGATGQLWLDGVFMGQKFLVRYGNLFNDATYANNEATQQLLVQHGHLRDPVTGLLYHAYDEPGGPTQSWVVPGTSHSPEFWCRAMGWYGMTMVETLETLPPGHANYPAMVSALQGLVSAWATFQDKPPRLNPTGRWFQLVDKGNDSRNWTETSCSSMYSYVISKSVQLGLVDPSFAAAANTGYAGVLDKISFGLDSALAADLTNITDICQGTNVGPDEVFYFDRPRPLNDRHGPGAFLIMYEHFAAAPPAVPAAPSNLNAADGVGQSVLTWTDNASNESGFQIERKPADSGSFAQIAQVPANTTTYTDVVAAGNYSYRVRAFNGPALSDYSNTDNAAVSAPTGPSIANLVVNDTASTNPPAGSDGIPNSQQWSAQASFGAGVTAFGDRTYTVSTSNAALNGKPWIRTAADSKNYTGNPLATFTLTGSAVFLLIDNRHNGADGRPSFLPDTTWVDQGYDVVIRQSATATLPYSVWRKSFPSGTISLPRVGSATAPCYLVVVE